MGSIPQFDWNPPDAGIGQLLSQLPNAFWGGIDRGRKLGQDMQRQRLLDEATANGVPSLQQLATIGARTGDMGAALQALGLAEQGGMRDLQRQKLQFEMDQAKQKSAAQSRIDQALGLGGGVTPAAPAATGSPAAPASYAAPSGGNLPRGFRNNNPGNIEDGPFAKSLPGYAGSDGRFARFNSMDEGVAASERLLDSYGRRGFNTVSAIVNRWAPASENGAATANYVAFVARRLGVDPNAPLDMSDPNIRKQIALAKGEFENGRPIPLAQRQAAAPDGTPVAPANAQAGQQPQAATPQAPAQSSRSTLPPDDPYPQYDNRTLMGFMRGADEGQRTIIKSVIERRQRFADDERRLQQTIEAENRRLRAQVDAEDRREITRQRAEDERAARQANQPTERKRRAIEAGLQPGTPEYQRFILETPADKQPERVQLARAAGLKEGTKEFNDYVLNGTPSRQNVPAGYERNDDGSYRIIPGGPADPEVIKRQEDARGKGQPKPLSDKAIGSLGEAGTNFTNASRFLGTFKDDYGGWRNQTVGEIANKVARFGGIGNEEAATWWQDYDRHKNQIRNQLFGSALTATEAEAFEKADINPGMTPQAIRRNLDIQKKAATSAAVKLAKVYNAQGRSQEEIEAAIGISMAELGIAPKKPGGEPTREAAPATSGSPAKSFRTPRGLTWSIE